MLQRLYVKNLALIEEIEVEFSKGLNILTGETGAGKSIILGSINLALGGRYTGDILPENCEYGLVELVFMVNKQQEERLKNLDIFPEDGLVVLNRKLMQGRSMSKINGETVTQTTLKKVSGILIDIYGQHEHHSLLQKKNHLEILDEYMGASALELKRQVKLAYKEYKEKLKELEEADTDIESRIRELSFLCFEQEEILNAHLIEGEDEDLELNYKKMLNSQKITNGLEEAYEYCAGYGQISASDFITKGIQSLQSAIDYDDTCLEFYNQLSEIDSLLNDFNRELSSYKEDLEFSQEEFNEVETRLNIWNKLKAKYGQSYLHIMEYEMKLQENIDKLQDYENYLADLEIEVDAAKNTFIKLASKLSKERKEQAFVFEKEVVAGLKELNFLDVKFEVEINSNIDKLQSIGIDDIGFLVSLNPGETTKPLAQVASGGELSRIMLVIKTVLSHKDNIGTMIFDEVDAGISGITGTKVGEKLALIGQHTQVICITHLAQIAALSTKHFMIEKEAVGGKTITNIFSLNYEKSIKELARILGGGTISEAIIQSARELKIDKS